MLSPSYLKIRFECLKFLELDIQENKCVSYKCCMDISDITWLYDASI